VSAGSSPAFPTNEQQRIENCLGVAKPGIAFRLGRKDRKFESYHRDQILNADQLAKYNMKAFLVIVFLINGEPSMNLEGYAPMETKLESCEDRIEFTLNYLNSVPSSTEVYGVYCDTIEGLENKFNIIFNSEPT
jgi:hypothetical protein